MSNVDLGSARNRHSIASELEASARILERRSKLLRAAAETIRHAQTFGIAPNDDDPTAPRLYGRHSGGPARFTGARA